MLSYAIWFRPSPAFRRCDVAIRFTSAGPEGADPPTIVRRANQIDKIKILDSVSFLRTKEYSHRNIL
eukprot:6380027-Pyramimonas_sp.AAC.2